MIRLVTSLLCPPCSRCRLMSARFAAREIRRQASEWARATRCLFNEKNILSVSSNLSLPTSSINLLTFHSVYVCWLVVEVSGERETEKSSANIVLRFSSCLKLPFTSCDKQCEMSIARWFAIISSSPNGSWQTRASVECFMCAILSRVCCWHFDCRGCKIVCHSLSGVLWWTDRPSDSSPCLNYCWWNGAIRYNYKQLWRWEEQTTARDSSIDGEWYQSEFPEGSTIQFASRRGHKATSNAFHADAYERFESRLRCVISPEKGDCCCCCQTLSRPFSNLLRTDFSWKALCSPFKFYNAIQSWRSVKMKIFINS